ncbi:MAG: DUF4465 domain-containing protein, partial [Bacteroidales bacterium]|nr:DUF4465 domain-containing protein [Bacteroidales bacterium]
YFNLQISAYAEGSLVDSREVVMADFANGNSYKMTDWTFVDLSWINAADSLTFIILSDDSGDYGINTPAYFCMDNFGAENNGETPVNQFVNTKESLNTFVDNCGNLVVSADDVIGSVSVYDLSGRLVASVDVNANYAVLPFDYKGMFVVSARTSKTCMTAKVVR